MAQPTTRRLAGAAGIMMASILLSRVLGLLREAIISGKLGQGAGSDVYMAAFQLPDALFFLIAGGALSSAFIPVFTEMLARGDEERAWQLFSTVACVMAVVVSVFIAVGFVFTRPLVSLLAFGFGPEMIDRIVPLTRIVLPAQFCFFLGGLMMGAQQARGRFLLPGMGPNVYNLAIIAGGLLLVDRIGTAGLCWGALAGAVAGNFFLQAWGMRAEGARFRVSFAWRDPDVAKVWKLMLPVILGLALPQVSIQLNKIFASTLGEGPMSALTRANVLMQAPLAIFGQSLSIAIFPTMAAQAALADWRRLSDTVGMGIRFVLFLTVPATALLLVLGKPLIAVLLQQGKFVEANTVETSVALSYYALGLFAWSSQTVLARGFYAMQDTRTPVIIGTVVTVIFVPLNLLFMRTLGMGFAGLALATSVAAALNCVAMLVVLHRRVRGRRLSAQEDAGGASGEHAAADGPMQSRAPGIDMARLGKALAQIGVASAAAAAASWGGLRALHVVLIAVGFTPSVKVCGLLELAVGGGAGIVAYIAIAHAMGLAELSQLRQVLRRRGQVADG